MDLGKLHTPRLREPAASLGSRTYHRVDLPQPEDGQKPRELPGLVTHYGRGTERLEGWFTHVSFALGGEAGSRLLKDLGVVVSGDTLLSHIRSMRLPSQETPRVLSVDDFAFRRGTRYGTVLVDLERRALVGVLADRSADTFARWLGEHPGVEVVSRDRGGEYAEAARRAVPHAVQVADRFHLLKNLGDVVSRVFRQHAEVLDLVPLEWRYEDVRHFRRAFVCGMSSIVQADYNTAQLPEAKMAS
jgi:hypothetical protein